MKDLVGSRAWGWNVIGEGRPGDLGEAFEVCTVAADCQAATQSGDAARLWN